MREIQLSLLSAKSPKKFAQMSLKKLAKPHSSAKIEQFSFKMMEYLQKCSNFDSR